MISPNVYGQRLIAILRHKLMTAYTIGWSSQFLFLFLMLIEHKKQHLWDRSCQILLLIWNMLFNCEFRELFLFCFQY